MVHTPLITVPCGTNMKKTKFLSLLLATALTVTSFTTATAFWEEEPAKPVKTPTTTSTTKKPKLSSKKINLKVGKTKTIKVKNGDKRASVTWKTSKKKVVKLTKKVKKGNKASVKLKALKAGKSTITAVYKLGKTKIKLTCKVTVKKGTTVTTPAPNPTVLPTASNPPTPPTNPPAPTDTIVTTPPTDAPTNAPTDAPTPTPTAPTPTPTAPTATPTAPTTPPYDINKDWSKPYDVALSTVRQDSTSKYDEKTGEVTINDTSGDSTTWFDLPDKVYDGETVEITINGTYTGDTGFRVWIGNGHNSYCDPEVFAKDFANGEFTRTFTITKSKEDGSPADKLTVKGPAHDSTVINGLTIKSFTVKYVDRPSKSEGSIALDLSKPESYLIDGSNTKAAYKDGALDASVNFAEGIIFKNPAKNPDDYKYVTVTYTSDRDMNAYIFDGEMGDEGQGREPDGQVQKDNLAKAETEKTVTYKAEKSMYGFKIVSLDWNDQSTPIGIKIKSVVFSVDEPDVPVPPTEAPTQTPAPVETAIPLEGVEDGDVYVYDVPVTALKLQASYVKDDKNPTNIIGLLQLESTINKYENVWKGVKALSDKGIGEVTLYSEDGTDITIKKESKDKAVITVVDNATGDTTTVEVTFTAVSNSSISADVKSADETFSFSVSAAEPSKAVLSKDGAVYNASAEKTAAGYCVTVSTQDENFAKLEKDSNKRTITISKVLVDNNGVKFGYFGGGEATTPTPTPVVTPTPEPTPSYGFNEDETEYRLELTADSVHKGSGWDPELQCTFNDDGSVTIVKTADIGVQLPKAVFSSHKFSKAVITYKDSTNAAGSMLGCVVKYDSESTSWADGEDARWGWNALAGEGTAEVIPNYDANEGKNFSGFRLFDGDANCSITITSIVFVK
ncbi:MAG: hypothetical protein HFH14_06280 [Lachnospiraceae bacterium]|nr:hypothetical protein [Lachnospiraceae bacterium]